MMAVRRHVGQCKSGSTCQRECSVVVYHIALPLAVHQRRGQAPAGARDPPPTAMFDQFTRFFCPGTTGSPAPPAMVRCWGCCWMGWSGVCIRVRRLEGVYCGYVVCSCVCGCEGL